MKASKKHRNYIEQNDVVLDPIVSIEKINIKFLKLNYFGLASK